MRLPEQRLWDSFSSHATSGLWLQRIENGLGAGMPDVLAIIQGNASWVELKARTAQPARDSTPVLGAALGLNTEQRNWHMDWHSHGGKSFILIGVGIAAQRQLFILPGAMADQVNGLAWMPLSKFKTNWMQIVDLLADRAGPWWWHKSK